MKTIAIANHKGGVGKTATAHTLGEALAFEHQRRVLLVDNDAQASLTGACGISGVEKGLAESLLGDIPLLEIVVDLAPNLSLVPSDLALTTLEMGLGTSPSGGDLLKHALSPASSKFDLTLIDCSPSLGLLTLNALAAADAVLIPTQPQNIDLRGLVIFMRAIQQVQQNLNPLLEILGILVTFYDQRLNHHRTAVQAMESAGLPVLDAKIGRSIRVAEAAEVGQSVIRTEPNNPQAENYRQLAAFVDRWLTTHQ